MRRVVLPQELPYGISAQGLGLRTRESSLDSIEFAGHSDFRGLQAFLCESRSSFGISDETLEGLVPERRFDPRPGAVFFGRWVGTAGPEVQVLEILIGDQQLDWEPGNEAILELHDGTKLNTEVDIEASTAAGLIGSGCMVRVGLRLDDGVRRKVRSVEIRAAGKIIRVMGMSR